MTSARDALDREYNAVTAWVVSDDGNDGWYMVMTDVFASLEDARRFLADDRNAELVAEAEGEQPEQWRYRGGAFGVDYIIEPKELRSYPSE